MALSIKMACGSRVWGLVVALLEFSSYWSRALFLDQTWLTLSIMNWLGGVWINCPKYLELFFEKLLNEIVIFSK